MGISISAAAVADQPAWSHVVEVLAVQADRAAVDPHGLDAPASGDQPIGARRQVEEALDSFDTDRGRVERDQVGKRAGCDDTPVGQPEYRCRVPGEPPDRL